MVLLSCAALAALGACGDDDAEPAVTEPPPAATTQPAPTTTPAPATTQPVATPGIDAGSIDAAITAAEDAIAQGDDLGVCPFGPIPQILAALPGSLGLPDGLGDDEIDDNGQLFFGGEVDITYCEVFDVSEVTGPVDEVRIDLAPGSDVDLQVYLDEEFGGSEDDFDRGSELLGGTARSGCIDDGVCMTVWQGDGLFIGTILRGDGPIPADDSLASATAVIPLVIENLAAGR